MCAGPAPAPAPAPRPVPPPAKKRLALETLESRDLFAVNPIITENLLPGSPQSEWDITGAGDHSIQGFATDISVDQGGVVDFKIDDKALAPYHIDIYRMGYYSGLGARRVATIPSSQVQRTAQPAPLTNASIGLVDAGNWSVSASWAVPSSATSGIYFAKLVREDTGGASHVYFVVRDDDGGSDLLFQTSDSTWQAYNDWGGNSLYRGSPDGRAYAVSYNRPMVMRDSYQGFLFDAEYPMVRWLEANGYNVSYSTDVDSDRRGSEILEHKAFLSVGHDEYWSGAQRANVEAARDAGVNLAFFSGNEVFWKTRWETSIDGSGTPYRTMVCYKETHAGAKIDPSPEWTGTWRDPRFSPPSNGGNPENALTGTIFMVNGIDSRAIQVPAADGQMRFWRNTSIASLAPGQVATLPQGTLGFEWDSDLDNGYRPAGLIRLSSTTAQVDGKLLLDNGSVYGDGTASHSLTLYRASSGALVFGAGTIRWSWGLDGNHDLGPTTADPRMQQATVNLFADMGIQPDTLQLGLVRAWQSTDATPPVSALSSPSGGTVVSVGQSVTITGTASDVGGLVGGVEVSVDGGQTWHPAVGRQNWSYTWVPTVPGPAVIRVRASDDSANVELPGSGVMVTVVSVPTSTTGLVAAYGFNAGSGSVLADSAGTNNGTISGATWTTGKFGQSLSFDGINDWVTVNDSNSLDLTTAMTLEAWVKPTTARTDFSTVVMKEQAGNFVYALDDADGAGRPPGGSIHNANGAATVVGWSVLPLDTWSHLATTYDGSMLRLYVNGTLVATQTRTGSIVTSNNPLRIGGNSIWGEYFAGQIDELRVYNRALSQNEIRIDMSTPVGGGIETTAPTVAVTGVTNGATISGTMTISANATDNVAINSVQYLINGQPLGSVVTEAPYTLVWDTRAYTNGTYVLTARAMDMAGNTATSSSLNVTIANASDTTAPTVFLSTPFHLSRVAGVTILNAVAKDTVGVVGVQFQLNGQPLGLEITSSPYRLAWDTTGVANGTYNLAAIARDAAGNLTTSAAVQVIVDNTAPTVATGTPAAGSTSVATNTSVTVSFSEEIYADTVAITLRDPANNAVPATITYDSETNTLTLRPSLYLELNTTYTVSLTAARDVVGNSLTGPLTWSFTTDDQAIPISNASLWNSSAVPEVTSAADNAPIELGVKFQSAVAGYITGVRFYKGEGNTGTHVGHLWDANGNLLASATFTNETATGWQQVNFDTPVHITANTVYVVSYYAPNGGYSADPGYFATAWTTESLSAPSSEAANGNGLFIYGGGFPDQSFSATNYWVDVVFSNILQDVSAPTVTTRSPGPGATNAGIYSDVTVTFSEAVQVTTIIFELRNPGGNLVPATVTYNATTQTVTLNPDQDLATNTVYTVTLSGAKDLVGNIMAPLTWSFTTANPDVVAPIIVSRSPTPNATGVPPASTVTVTFNEPIHPPSLSMRLIDQSTNTEVPAVVIYDEPTRTVTLYATLPGFPVGCCGACLQICPLRANNGYTAVLSHVQDLAGNVMQPVSWSFTTDLAIVNATLWNGTATPTISSVNDPSAVEVGVQFQTSTPGYVTGVRFYKGEGNTGTHVGHLWTASGNLVASGTFTDETASGWQQVNFGMPVLIQANTPYVVSYYAPNGGYSATPGYFTSTWTSAPLTALSSPAVGGNGLFKYGTGGGFPNESFGATNYWVDVVFSNILGDVNPPTVTAQSPAPGTTGVSTTATITATFSEAVQPETIHFVLRDAANSVVPASVSYNESTHVVTLVPHGVLTSGTTYTATISEVLDLAGNGMTAASWSFTVGTAIDSTPPAVTMRSPAAGATGVLINAGVTVMFGEAVQPETINFVLKDAANNIIPASVTYDAASRTATLQPQSPLAFGSIYTASVSGVKDLAGNTMTGTDSWAFMTMAPVVNANLFGLAVPEIAEAGDTAAVELGVKFQVDLPGYITGVRFYKAAGNIGTHVGHLWDAAGNLLATAMFTNETASGWQEVNFGTPILVNANTTYIISYYAPQGHYSFSGGYFASAANSGVLHAPSAASAGGNGVYRYGSGGGFPDQTYNAANYWVDVVFNTQVDTTPPTVTGRSPTVGGTAVSTTGVVTATFGEAVRAGTISFVLKDAANNVIPAIVSYNESTNTAILMPSAPLADLTTYTASISGVKDLTGNTMVGTDSWTFTTSAAWRQTSATDFSAGSRSDTMGTNRLGGEIQLTPTYSDDFTGSSLSGSWQSTSWASHGGGPLDVMVSDGIVALQGGLLSVPFSGVAAVEGRVNFGAVAFQHFGLGTNLDSPAGNSWAVFGTGATTDTLFARVNANGTLQDVNLGPLPNGFHLYKIKPVANGYEFYLDNVLLTSVNAAVPATGLRILLSAFQGAPQGAIQADWVRVANYPSSGTFTSAVFDAGRTAVWGGAEWTDDLPAGTTVVVETRSGDTSAPDGTWSSWAAVNNGSIISSPDRRYLQYRIVLSTTDPTVSPVLDEITLYWS